MSLAIRLLGLFEVVVDDVPVPATAWKRRASADLVKLLALAPTRVLHRERVLDALWPDVPADLAAPRLHKAAHYARRALGRDDAVVLRGGTVTLLPDETDVVVDVVRFDRLATEAEARGDRAAAERALAAHGGPLLPEDPYEGWAEVDRDRVAARHVALLRQAGRWSDLLAVDPTDEAAHVALMREHARIGDRRAALRQYERLDRALRQELGVSPGRAATALRDQLLAGVGPRAVLGDEDDELVGRDREIMALERLLDRTRVPSPDRRYRVVRHGRSRRARRNCTHRDAAARATQRRRRTAVGAGSSRRRGDERLPPADLPKRRLSRGGGR